MGREVSKRAIVAAVCCCLWAPSAVGHARHSGHHTRHGRHPATSSPKTALPSSDPRLLSSSPIAEDPRWRGYVLDPQAPVVYPRAVSVSDPAAVSNPSGLLEGGGGTTIHASGAGNPTLTLDLGIDTGGRVEVGISKTDGTAVDLAYSEARSFMTGSGDSTAGSLGNDDDPDGRSDTINATGPTQFSSPGIRGGERWISLSLGGAGTVTIDYVRVRVGNYRPAVDDYVGRFLSSDGLLNRIWYGGVYTFNLDAIRDVPAGTPTVVVDGAKRDRLVWLGDLGVETLTAAYSTRAAPQIARDSIDMFSCQQDSTGYVAMASDIYVTCPGQPPPPGNPPASTQQTNALIRYGHLPEYPAWWVIAEAEAFRYGGDVARAQALLPVMRRVISYMAANVDANGLFRTSTGLFPINWHPFDVAYGEDAHTNATWIMALHDLAGIERLVGDPAQAAADEQRAASMTAAMLAHLWDPQAGAFLLNTYDPLRDHSQDAQVGAVLAGVGDASQATSALDFIARHLETSLGPLNGESGTDPFMSQYISPYMSGWELLARFGRHDGAGALGLLRREYGYMVTHDPASTMWEKLATNGDPASYNPNQVGNGIVPTTSVIGAGSTSLAHGWSTGPVAALSGYVLGLRPTSPGWRDWIVEPQPVDLRFAQGQAQTPYGPLASRWERGAGDQTLRLTVSAPAGTSGQVAVPLLGADRAIARDGRLVWAGGRPVGGAQAVRSADEVLFAAGAGAHTYAWGPLSANRRAARRRRA